MATIKIIVTPLADADVNNIADFLQESRSPELAIRFVNAFYKSLDIIEFAPEIGTPSFKVVGVRRKMIDKYNALYYELVGDTLYALRVIDTRSNPDANPY
ncbi:type II toxin-antitoxin system RelE/ParE family toxin [Spirosoma arcticum]